MFALLLACSPSAAPPPPTLAPAASPSGSSGGDFAGPGPAPVPTATETAPTLLGFSPPSPGPAPAPVQTLCPGWDGQFVVPGRLSVVECGAERVAMTGHGDLLETCASVQAGLREAGWVDVSAGTFRYALTRGEAHGTLTCLEIPKGVLVTVTVD